VELSRVRKVMRAQPVRPLVASPDFVAGAIRAEGRLEVLVDLAVLFGDPAATSEANRAILVSLDGRDFGLLADEVGDVEEVPAESLQPLPPFLGGARRAALRGVTVRGGEEVLVLDLDRLLDGAELAAAMAAGSGEGPGSPA
jgi:purine-binding chemotaxis protein CheW